MICVEDPGDLPEGFELIRHARGPFTLPPWPDVRHKIDWEHRGFRMFGRDIKQPRLTAWYGDAAYTYSGQRHEPRAMPLALVEIRVQLDQRLDANFGFNTCLCNLYRDGRDSVAWHADDEPELGAEPDIASVSFGASRAFQIRRANQLARRIGPQTYEVELRHGDVLIMSGRSQLDYEHSVPKRAGAIGERVNLTFRRILTAHKELHREHGTASVAD